MAQYSLTLVIRLKWLEETTNINGQIRERAADENIWLGDGSSAKTALEKYRSVCSGSGFSLPGTQVCSPKLFWLLKVPKSFSGQIRRI